MHDPIKKFGQRLVQMFAYLVRIILQNKNTDSPKGINPWAAPSDNYNVQITILVLTPHRFREIKVYIICICLLLNVNNLCRSNT